MREYADFQRLEANNDMILQVRELSIEKYAQNNCKCNKSLRFLKMKMFAVADPPMPKRQRN
jgi:hypothetical protein